MTPEIINEIGTISMAVFVLVEIIKKAGFKTRFAGLLAIFLGILICVVQYLTTGRFWFEGLVLGFFAGAVAAGVYAGVKALFKERTDKTVPFEDDPALRPPC